MKVRNLFFAVLASAAVLVGCQEKENEIKGDPSLTLNPSELTFDQSADMKVVEVTANREWKAEFNESWITLSVSGGAASETPYKVEVSVLPNEGLDRTASVVFTIGTVKKTLTVKQSGPSGSAEDLIVYHNNFDKSKDTKPESGWGKNTLDVSTGWRNETGTGISNVEYAYNGMSVRNGNGVASSAVDGGSSLYEGSGVNNIFFGSSNYFQIKNIALDASKKNYKLSFGAIRSVFNTTPGDGNSILDANQFSVYVSNDGTKWVKLSYTFAAGSAPDGKWDLLTSEFTLPDNTSSLYLYFTTTEGSTYRIDDLDLSVSSEAGTAIDFSNGIELGGGSTGGGEVVGTPEGNGTEASPYNVAAVQTEAQKLAAGASSEDVYMKGIISSIKEVSAQYGNATYYISDDGTTAGQFEVFRGKYLDGASFTSEDQIKVGDQVVIFGKLTNYNGTLEVAQNSKIVSLNGKTEDDTKRLSVSTTSINVSADAESATFKVSGNVSWTASVTEGNFVKILSGASGNGAGDVVLELTKNESEESARTAKITVSTTEDAATKSYVVTLTQDKKSVGGGEGGEAVEISWTAADWSEATGANVNTLTKNGYTITIDKVNGSTAPALRSDGSVRLYAKGTLTISGPEFKSVEIVLAGDAGFRHCAVTADSGEVGAQATGETSVYWTGSASEVMFTVGDKAIYGSDGADKAGQLRFSKIIIK